MHYYGVLEGLHSGVFVLLNLSLFTTVCESIGAQLELMEATV